MLGPGDLEVDTVRESLRAPPPNDDLTPPSFFILDIVLFHDDPLAALAIVRSFKNVASLDRSWTPPPF
jgi:hypothetical protein